MFNNKILFYFSIIALQFLSGSVMYSYIFAKLIKIDLTKVRDGNPGSSNLWRAGGWKWGFIALALDYFKGTLPLTFFILKYGQSLNKYVISFAALTGILGHAFSPMLKFKGGKAIATSFGAWSVLTKWEGPTILGGVFTAFSVYHRLIGKKGTTPEDDTIRVLFGYIALLVYVIWKFTHGYYELTILYIGNLLVILFKHRSELAKIIFHNKAKARFHV